MHNAHDLATIEQYLTENRLVLLYVQAPNCGVCTVFRKQVAEVVAELPEIAGIETNIATVPMIASRFHVLTAPAVLFFADGKEIWRSARYINMRELKEVLGKYIKEYTA
ncbi:thioredoxin family protein [Actinobacillus capsulatus]|uniref:thioredoxin family protein n=1 Tax=Actinobacillus capsulatus TaxID=717 RepID=UPI00037E1CFC|nr:thioredoxin family protein [Actinobacillus capsulatus]